MNLTHVNIPPAPADVPAKRLTIGLITSGIGNPVSSNLWLGVVDAARQHDVNLLCFVGEALQSPHGFKALANAVYDLISPERVDGLLFWNSALNNYVKGDAFQRFREQFQPLPMVDVEESPVVLTDNYSYQGMRVAIQHLLEVHHRRRIAFIRGPEGNCEAEYRYQAYLDVLRDYRLRFESDLVTPPGTWAGTWAQEALRLLLERRQISFDGLAAPSDLLAVSAMEALQARGLHVPKEVAVVGIDDSIEGRYATPPLTTMPYSLWAIGQQGVARLLAVIKGRGQTPAGAFPTALKIRQSCGCLAPSLAQVAAGSAAVAQEPLAAALAKQRESILAEIAQALHGAAVPAMWGEQLAAALTAELSDHGGGEFLDVLDALLRQGLQTQADLASWQDAVSVLRRRVLPYLVDRDVLLRAEDLWQQARIMIGEAVQRELGSQKLQAEQQARILREISARLISTFDIQKLMDILAEELPRLHIASCYLALYESPQAPTEWARLILAYHEQGRIPLEPAGRRLPSRQLIPPEFLPPSQRYRMVSMPLYFEHHLGFVLFEVGSRQGSVYGMLSGQISSALQGALLVQSVNAHAAEIARYRDRLEELVEERTAALERTNVLLQQEVTEHARAEQALRDSEQQYRLLAENVKEGIVIVQDGRLSFANHAFVAMSGWTTEHLGNADLINLFPPASREMLRQQLPGDGFSADANRWQVEMLTSNGGKFWAEIEQTRIVWNSHPALLLTIRNMTERKRREQRLEEERARLEQENLSLKSTIKERYRFGPLVGKSLPMQRVYELIVSAAASDVNVLLSGESGTGKELIARTLHQTGPRRAQKFVPVNCASIPEALFEREFFGHRRGAFTGADRDKPGLFDQAHKGTLFLDEVTELTPGMQAKLLRVLQDGEYLPLGSPISKQTDAVIIAATNKDCRVEIEQGRLRKDFFYRIGVIEITVPALRERKDDLPLLIEAMLAHYRQKYAEMHGPAARPVSTDQAALPGELVQALYNYDWPGNVRELQNVLQRYLATHDVPSVLTRIGAAAPIPTVAAPPARTLNLPLPDALKAFEKQKIAEILAVNHYNTRKTAEMLGIPLTTLYYKLKCYQLKI